MGELREGETNTGREEDGDGPLSSLCYHTKREEREMRMYEEERGGKEEAEEEETME